MSAKPLTTRVDHPLGTTLRMFGITSEDIDRALAYARDTGQKVGEALVAMDLVTEKELEVALAMQRSDRTNGTRSRKVIGDVLRVTDYAIERTRRATKAALRVQKITGEFPVVTDKEDG